MINAKRILLYLPLYLVWAVTIDVLFDRASPPVASLYQHG